MSSRRGFTLVEVMVAIAMAVVVMAGLTQILLNAERLGLRARARAAMSNNGAIAAQLMRQDLGQAGLGVPRGMQEMPPPAVNGFYAVVLVAAPTEVGIVADLARPDANFSTFGLLDDRHPIDPSEQKRHLAWHTDNNGGCMPQTGGTSCSTAASSLFFPSESGCTSAATVGDRTCPWGLKRLRGSERFQIIAANGRWHPANNLPTLTSKAAGPDGMLMLDMGTDLPATWTNDTLSALPIAGASQGWVTSLDRVFFRHNEKPRTLERIQCWGTPNMTSASWPPAAATAVPATPCAAGQGMADWEVIATEVDSVAFTYFDASGAAVTNANTAVQKRAVRRIEYNVLFKKIVAGQEIRHELVGGVFLGMAI